MNDLSAAPRLPLFDGFPYLLTRVAPSFYHVILLPAEHATGDEVIRLTGRQVNGVPTGLVRCPSCHDWRGECLDPNPRPHGLVVRAHCRCENDNCCARCGELLHDRRLDANYYNPDDGQV